MARVCVDCGTPKPPLLKGIEKTKHYCFSCEKETLTHQGEARDPICYSCVHFKAKDSRGKLFSALDFHPPEYERASCSYFEEPRLRERVFTNLNMKMARYGHYCQGHEFHYKADRKDTPNPLSPGDVEQYHLFEESPSAFWLDPSIWDNVEDPYREEFWYDPGESNTGTVKAIAAGLAGVGAALGALSLRKKFDSKA